MVRDEVKLHRAEILSYFVVWTTVVFYGIYNVYKIGYFFQHDLYTEDFTTGWMFPNSRKDVSDYEWKVWIPILLSMIPWFATHLVIAEFFRWYNIKFLPGWYISISSIFLTYTFGLIATVSLLFQPVIFWIIAHNSRNKWLTWTTALAMSALLNTHFFQDFVTLPEELSYSVAVIQGWLHLRCLSYALDVQSERAQSSFLHMISYCCYLPLIVFGPVTLYSDFRNSMDQQFSTWTVDRTLSFLFGLLRYSFWLLVNEAWLHVIYSNALSYQPDIVWELDAWTLYGLGYCLGQYFMIKYTVVYGIPGILAKAERVPAPDPPKCIGRIHLYSEMWRTFDQGLYFFLCRYIYIPIANGRDNIGVRVFASLLCFCFVYIWHGTMMYILVWSALNFLGVVTESLARNIAAIPSVQSWKSRWFGARGSRRFDAALASPLLFMSALSNFYFFAGLETGNVFVARAIQGITSSSLVLLLFIYCCCQVSIEVKMWEQRSRSAKCRDGDVNKYL